MLVKILEHLKVIIRLEKLYDPRNTTVMMFDPDLEAALSVRDLHVTEVRDQILKQLIRIRRQNWKENFNNYIYRSEGTMASSGLTWRPTSRHMARIVNVSTILIKDKEAKFIIKPLLMRLLRAECEGKDRNKIVFKYEEIVGLLSKYIMKRRNSLFDHRNI